MSQGRTNVRRTVTAEASRMTGEMSLQSTPYSKLEKRCWTGMVLDEVKHEARSATTVGDVSYEHCDNIAVHLRLCERPTGTTRTTRTHQVSWSFVAEHRGSDVPDSRNLLGMGQNPELVAGMKPQYTMPVPDS